jgi:hypothetical protein
MAVGRGPMRSVVVVAAVAVVLRSWLALALPCQRNKYRCLGDRFDVISELHL